MKKLILTLLILCAGILAQSQVIHRFIMTDSIVDRTGGGDFIGFGSDLIVLDVIGDTADFQYYKNLPPLDSSTVVPITGWYRDDLAQEIVNVPATYKVNIRNDLEIGDTLFVTKIASATDEYAVHIKSNIIEFHDNNVFPGINIQSVFDYSPAFSPRQAWPTTGVGGGTNEVTLIAAGVPKLKTGTTGVVIGETVKDSTSNYPLQIYGNSMLGTENDTTFMFGVGSFYMHKTATNYTMTSTDVKNLLITSQAAVIIDSKASDITIDSHGGTGDEIVFSRNTSQVGKFSDDNYMEINNRLSIGKTDPLYPLDVAGETGIDSTLFLKYLPLLANTDTLLAMKNDTIGYVLSETVGDTALWYIHADSIKQLDSTKIARLYTVYADTIGIGTTPAYPLDVAGVGHISDTLYLGTQSYFIDQDKYRLYVSATKYFEFRNSAIQMPGTASLIANTQLTMSSAGGNYATINAGGMGINTATQAYPLDVSGRANADTLSVAGTENHMLYDDGIGNFNISKDGTSGNTIQIKASNMRFGLTSTAYPAIRLEPSTSTNPTFITQTNYANTGLGGAPNELALIVGGVNKLNATSTGIGVGTLIPLFELDVDGGIAGQYPTGLKSYFLMADSAGGEIYKYDTTDMKSILGGYWYLDTDTLKSKTAGVSFISPQNDIFTNYYLDVRDTIRGDILRTGSDTRDVPGTIIFEATDGDTHKLTVSEFGQFSFPNTLTTVRFMEGASGAVISRSGVNLPILELDDGTDTGFGWSDNSQEPALIIAGVSTATATATGFGIFNTDPVQELDVNGNALVSDTTWLNDMIYIDGRKLVTNPFDPVTGVYIGDVASSIGSGSVGNVVIGTGNSGDAIISGDSDVIIGRTAGDEANFSNSTITGAFAYGNATGNIGSVIAYGFKAGTYETEAYKLFVDAVDRGDEARGRTNSMIYGVMNADSSQQILQLGGMGKVGIGTITPKATLDVEGITRAKGLTLKGFGGETHGIVTFGDTITDFWSIYKDDDDFLQIRVNSSTPLVTLDSAQKVGIGVTLPSYKLEVIDTIHGDALHVGSDARNIAGEIIFESSDGDVHDIYITDFNQGGFSASLTEWRFMGGSDAVKIMKDNTDNAIFRTKGSESTGFGANGEAEPSILVNGTHVATAKETNFHIYDTAFMDVVYVNSEQLSINSLTDGWSSFGYYNSIHLSNTPRSATRDLTAVGYNSALVTAGQFNAAFGGYSMDANTTGARNTAIGQETLSNNTTAGNNTALGFRAMGASTGSNNTGLGAYSLYNTTTEGNVSIGYYSMYYAGDGLRNVAIGALANRNNRYGDENVMIGYEAGYNTSSALSRDGNVWIGHKAGKQLGAINDILIITNDSLPIGQNLIEGDFADSSLVINGELSTENTHAEMYDPVTAISTGSTSVWYALLGWTGGETQNASVDVVDSMMILNQIGTYYINYSVSYTHSVAGTEITTGGFVRNGAGGGGGWSIIAGSKTIRKVGTSGDKANASTGFIYTTTAISDTLGVRIQSSGTTGTFTPTYGNLTATRIN